MLLTIDESFAKWEIKRAGPWIRIELNQKRTVTMFVDVGVLSSEE